MSFEQLCTPWDREVPSSPNEAQPVVTFSGSVTFHMNGDEIRAFHVDPAPTDGDSIVRFRNAKVAHVGDILFNGTSPFIDVEAGGSIRGMIAACDRVLRLTDADTRIIAGHGPPAALNEILGLRISQPGPDARHRRPRHGQVSGFGGPVTGSPP